MSSYLVEQLAELRAEVAALREAQVRYIEAPVSGTDVPGSTFSVTVAGQSDGRDLDLSGISAPAQFLPAAGEVVRLAVAGAQPMYTPSSIAENAVTNREIAPGSVAQESLGFDIGDLGGTTIFYGSVDPTGQVYGDLWLKEIGTGPGNVSQYETRRWVPGSPDSWQLLADQSATQALLDAATAQTAADTANQQGIDALAAANTAQSAAGTAQTTAQQAVDNAATAQTAADTANTAALSAAGIANGKGRVYYQTTAPSPVDVNGLWIDSDDGNKPYVGATGAWVLRQDAGIQAAATAAAAANTAAGNAQSTANTAINNAAAANTLASQAKTSADSKITVYRQSTAPSGGTYKVNGDLWIDSAGMVYYASTTSGGWTATPDQRIATALTTANSASTTAASKTTVFAQISAPSTTGRTTGDIWLDTDDGNKRNVWDGAAWTASTIGATGLLLADSTDYVPNPQFDPALGSSGYTILASSAAEVPAGCPYANVAKLAGRDHPPAGYEPLPVQPGEAFYVSALVASTAGSTASFNLYFYEYKPKGVHIGFPGGGTTAAGTSWRRAEFTYTVPTNGSVTHLTPFLQIEQNSPYGSVWYATDWHVRRANTARTITATARQLGAITTYKQASAPTTGMIVGDFWIRTPDNLVFRYEGSTPAWVASQDAAINTAITNAATAQAVADGKMRIFVQDSAPTGLGAGDVGDLWIETDNGNRAWTWSGTAWADRRIGNGAIQPKSIVASDVIATGTVTAALMEAVLVLATQVIAGNPNAPHAAMTPTGFKLFTVSPDGGIREAGGLGTDTDDYLTLTGPDGQITTSIDVLGIARHQGLSVTGDPIFMGKRFSEALVAVGRDDFQYGSSLAAIGNVTAEIGLTELQVDVPRGGRTYLLGFSLRAFRSEDATEVYVSIRDGDSGAPGLNSNLLMRRVYSDSRPGYHSHFGETDGIWFPTAGKHRLLLTVGKTPTTPGYIDVQNGLGVGTDATLFSQDVGPVTVNRGVVNRGGGGTTAPPAKGTTTANWLASWTQTFDASGLRTDTTDGLQGYSRFYPAGGNQACQFGFPAQLFADLQGATIQRVEIYLYATHWDNEAGGTAVIGTHNNLLEPGSFTGHFPDRTRVAGWGRGEGRWIDVSYWGAGLLDGSIRGILLGPGPTNGAEFYGRFDGANGLHKPSMRVTYTK